MPTFFIRSFRPGDAPALRSVFHAAVHHLTSSHYSVEQRAAWAPAEYDASQWAARMQANQPFVAEADGGTIAGFADLQSSPSGYIDMFFVAPVFARQGVGRALMAHIHAQAAQRGLVRLWANVSLAAEPFFVAQGFAVEARQAVERAGVVLHNARMGKAL